jgi:hypothetical protein
MKSSSINYYHIYYNEKIDIHPYKLLIGKRIIIKKTSTPSYIEEGSYLIHQNYKIT